MRSTNLQFAAPSTASNVTYEEIANRSNELYDMQATLLAGQARGIMEQCYKGDNQLPKILNALDSSYRNNLFSDVRAYALRPGIFGIVAYDRIDRMDCAELLERQKVVFNQILSFDKNIRDLNALSFPAATLSAKSCSPAFQPNVSGMLERFNRDLPSMREMLTTLAERNTKVWMILQGSQESRGCLLPLLRPSYGIEPEEPSTVSP